MLLWLWSRLAATAAALIQPLVWELPYAAGVALRKEKKKIFSGRFLYFSENSCNFDVPVREGELRVFIFHHFGQFPLDILVFLVYFGLTKYKVVF